MATMDVFARAAKANINLIVTLEPTFFGRLDAQPIPANSGGRGQNGVNPYDPVYIAKREFIQKNGLVVWRFSDHWRARKPDPFAIGLAGALGCEPISDWLRSISVRSAGWRFGNIGGHVEEAAQGTCRNPRHWRSANARAPRRPSSRVVSTCSHDEKPARGRPDSGRRDKGMVVRWNTPKIPWPWRVAERRSLMLGCIVSEDLGMNGLRRVAGGVGSRNASPVAACSVTPYWRPA